MAELAKLGRYQLKRVLGKGAMGVVYEGYDPTLNRHVAVKTILKSVAIDAETAAAYSARFVREAQAVARLNHPHIVQVHDFGEQDEVAYLVMEFIEGRELRAYFDSGEKFAPAEVVRIMGELLDALDFAHERGVIHRDVKPANVMLDAHRRAKLADFGVARIQDSDRSLAGTMVGTPAFMSPEQIQGGKVDGRSDIFSAGTILYQLLTGEQPFKGAGAWTVAKQIVEVDPPAPSTLALAVSPALDAVVRKALAKEPAQRFGKAREFAAALRAALVAPQPAEKPDARSGAAARGSEAEVEFWRSIQNSSDPAELESYLQEFPQGTYAQLARIKMAKLREPLEAARKAAEEKERAEVEARAKREAGERAAREAEDRAKREAGERARREAAEKAKREAEDKSRRDAVEKARREADEKARQAQAQARLKQQQEEAAAKARAKAAADENATVADVAARHVAPQTQVAKKSSLTMPAIALLILAATTVGAYLVLGRKPAPVAEAPASAKAEAPPPASAAPPKPEITQADVEKIKKETEERIRREYADKSAAEQAALAKAAAEKATQEKLAAMKAAAVDKAAADKAAAEKAAAERQIAAAKSASERAALEKAAAEKAAAEKAAAERAAAEKAAQEKAAGEKAAAAKAAAVAKPGWPSVGDRWNYEFRDLTTGNRTQLSVEVESATAAAVRDASRVAGGASATVTHQGAAVLTGIAPGVTSLWPYLRAFQEVRGGERWNDIDIRQLGQCSSWQCSASARVVGKEQVSVRAGTFTAWKIVAEMAMIGPSLDRGTGEYTFWYSEDANRIVKYQSRFRIAGRGGVVAVWTDPDVDMELVSYAPAGGASARAAAEKPAVVKAPAKAAAGSAAAQLERFIQRHGKDKVMSTEPPQVPGGMRHGEIVYVNDGSCPPGRIREVTGGPTPAGGTSYQVGPRSSRCIPLE